MSDDLLKSSAYNIAEKCRAKKLDVGVCVKNFLDRIESLNPKFHAVVHIDYEDIDKQTKEVKERIASGDISMPLCGVPVVVKDNISTKNVKTTCASKMLSDFKPIYDATVVKKLKKAGAILIAKANMDEFAMGSSNENTVYAIPHNPWKKGYVTGGSSGGSASAVGLSMSPLSLGSDTGGSIRQPASLCGVFGFKPSYGAVSRYGLIAFASSLDQIGPFAKTTEDLSLLFDVIRGHDPKDATTLQRAVPSVTEELTRIDSNYFKGKKIGVVREFDVEGVSKDTIDRMSDVKDRLRKAGASIVEVSLPSVKYSLSCYYVLATAEASSNLARFDGIRFGHKSPHATDLESAYQLTRVEGFGREVKQRIMLGTFALASGYYDAYYSAAVTVKNRISQEFANAFMACDFIVSPTSPTTAFKHGDKAKDPLAMYLSDIFTIGVNLAGLPGVSVPVGLDSEGLPVGCQVLAKHWDDSELLKASKALDSLFGFWTKETPKL